MERDYTKEEILTIFTEYYNVSTKDEFLNFVADRFYDLQKRIKEIEEKKLSKAHLREFIYNEVKKAKWN